MFASGQGGNNPADYDTQGLRSDDLIHHRRPSPDIDATSADPLRTQFPDYDGDSRPGSRRESFLDSDLEMRKYQGLSSLSASGVAGYQAVGGEHSEPGSPVQGEGYERSHESGSSGTKVDRAVNPRPETMSSDGSFDNRDRNSALGGAHTVSPTTTYFNRRRTRLCQKKLLTCLSLTRHCPSLTLDTFITMPCTEETTPPLATSTPLSITQGRHRQTSVDTVKVLSVMLLVSNLVVLLPLAPTIVLPTICLSILLASPSITSGETRTIKVATLDVGWPFPK